MDPVVTELSSRLAGSMLQHVNVHSVLQPNIFPNALMKVMGIGAVLLSTRVTLLPSIFLERFYKNRVARVLAQQQLIKTPEIFKTRITHLCLFKLLTERAHHKHIKSFPSFSIGLTSVL